MQHDIGHYNELLVLLSIIVAIVASYTAIGMIERMFSSGKRPQLWMLLTSLVMGFGIWSMHFIGMLAFQTEFSVAYDLSLMFVSIILPMLAVYAALLLIVRQNVKNLHMIMGALFVGLAIISMHYTGMLSMDMPARLTHDPFLFILSHIIAFVISFGSLYLSFAYRSKRLSHIPFSKIWVAILLGGAVSGMHYTAMFAARFTPLEVSQDQHVVIDNSLLAMLVGSSTLFILILVLVGLFIDRHRVLLAAQFNEQRYSTLFERSPDMVVCYDASDFSVISVNPSVYNILGYTLEELKDLPRGYTLYNQEDRKKILDSYVHAVRGQSQNIEFSARHKEGYEVILSSSIFPLFLGKQKYVYVISKDITEQRMDELELMRAKEAAESATRMKSQFLATMSHEIRTPLNGIIGINQLLLESELDDSQKELLLIQQKSSNALLHVINDILDFAKIEAGKVKLIEESFSLLPCIEECFDLFTISTRSKQLEVSYLIDSNIPEILIGDLVRLRQILVNLIGNAVKFTVAGYVRLEVKLISKEEDDIILEFTITDTGIGIDDNSIDMLFLPFAQIDSSLRRKFEGTGLGLAICKNLVELMGGQIWAIKGKDKGAAFQFRVPFKHA
jgi:PAS domain S-box-containing protein